MKSMEPTGKKYIVPQEVLETIRTAAKMTDNTKKKEEVDKR